jgi:hypothetical protein
LREGHAGALHERASISASSLLHRVPQIGFAGILENRATFVGAGGGAVIPTTTLPVLLVREVRTLERGDVDSVPDAEGIAAA